MMPIFSLLEELLAQSDLPDTLHSLAAALLLQLNDTLAPSLYPPNSCVAGVAKLTTGDSLSDDKMRTLLTKLNKKFIENIKKDCFNEDDRGLFECLKKIGLYNSELKETVVCLMKQLRQSPHITAQYEAQQVLLWLQNEQLSIEIICDQQNILNNVDKVDSFLPFLEDYIIDSLENRNENPYVPFSIAIANQNSCVDSDELCLTEQVGSNNAAAINSCYTTPRTERCTDDTQSIALSNNVTSDAQSLYSFLPKLNLQENMEESPYSSLLSSSIPRSGAREDPAHSTSSSTRHHVTLSGSGNSSLTVPSLSEYDDTRTTPETTSILSRYVLNLIFRHFISMNIELEIYV